MARRRGVTRAGVRTLALALPGVVEGTSYGTPAWKSRGKLVARLHPDGESLVVRASFDQRDALVRADPRAFFFTDHYAGHEMLQVRLAAVDRETLREVLEASWRQCASARAIAAFEAER